MTLVWGAPDIGLATGVLGSIHALAGAVAQALYVSVFMNKLQENIPAYVTPAVMDAGLPASSLPALFAGVTTGSFANVPGISDNVIAGVAAALKTAYSQIFRIVFLCTIPFSVILIVASCLVPNMEKILHNNVAKRLQGQEKDAPSTNVVGRGTGQVPAKTVQSIQMVERKDDSAV